MNDPTFTRSEIQAIVVTAEARARKCCDTRDEMSLYVYNYLCASLGVQSVLNRIEVE